MWDLCFRAKGVLDSKQEVVWLIAFATAMAADWRLLVGVSEKVE